MTNRKSRWGVRALALAFTLSSSFSVAQSATTVPTMVKFSGTVQGKPTSIIGVTFALYKDQQGGAPLWLETQSVSLDGSGRYTVQLGATLPAGLPKELFASGEARWLGVQAESQPEQPRVLLLSVPYALKAADAETVGGFPPSSFVLATSTGSATQTATNAATSSTVSPAPPPGTVSGSGTANFLPLWTDAADIGNSVVFQSGTGTAAKIGINTSTPSATLDVKGGATIRGLFTLPSVGVATATKGANSQALALTTSGFNSSSKAAVNQNFRWQAEPAGNNTSSPSGTLNLLFGSGTSAPTETGLKINNQGLLTFATGQTFPGTGNGTITGVTPGTALTGGGSSGDVTLNVDTTKVPLLNASNTFAGNQSILGNLTSTGTVTGSVVNASSYSIGGSITPFLSGSINGNNAFLGFAGNSTTTGINNIAAGPSALFSNTTGGSNTAVGQTALNKNSTGSSSVAVGTGAAANNTTGGSNTAVGGVALTSNITGSYNTGLGYGAGPDVNSPALTNATAVGAFATVSKSNALVLGGTGANAVNVGIGTATPASTLDVHGTGNFTGPITFAAGQTFPGAGTITGVTAGTGLSGGGTSGTVSLSLNVAYSDGRYAQLAANNTFSGVQVINNNVGIGISSPVYALHTMGTIRSETGGLSIGGNAPWWSMPRGSSAADLPFWPTDQVGINNSNPQTTLDVGGNINASGTLTTSAGATVGGPLNVQSSLTIKNDQPMNAAPRLFLSGFFGGNLFQGQNGGVFRLTKGMIITRVLTVGQFAYVCSPLGAISILNINTGGTVYTLSIYPNGPTEYSADSGPLSIPIPDDTILLLQVTQQPVCGLLQGPNNINMSVEYVMQ